MHFSFFLFLWSLRFSYSFFLFSSVIRSQNTFISRDFGGGRLMGEKKRKRKRSRSMFSFQKSIYVFFEPTSMPGSASSRLLQQHQGGGGGGGAPPPPPPQHVPAGFDPSTGTYMQPVVYQQQPQQVKERDKEKIRFPFFSFRNNLFSSSPLLRFFNLFNALLSSLSLSLSLSLSQNDGRVRPGRRAGAGWRRRRL